MIMKSEFERLEVSVKLSVAGKDYVIFISNDSMKCFRCGKPGHVKQNCPDGKDGSAANAGPSGVVPNVPLTEPEPQARGSPETVTVPEKSGDKTDFPTEPPPPAESVDVDTGRGDVIVEQSSENARAPSDSSDPSSDAGTASGGAPPESQMQRSDVQSEEGLASEGDDALSINSMNLSDGEIEVLDDTIESSQDSVAAKGKNVALYSVEELNDFLDRTFSKRNINVEKWFPNLGLFLQSCVMAFKKASMEELEQTKRYRLKKIMGAVKQKLKHRSQRPKRRTRKR